MKVGGQDSVDCSRCGGGVSIDDASMLIKKDSKGLARYVCPGCLQDLHVPKGYELKRDLSFLRAGSPKSSTVESEGRRSAPAGAATAPGEPRRDSTVIADFWGQLVTGDMPRGILTPGRILMNRQCLVLATEGYETSIPFGSIRDVALRHVAESTRDDYDDIVTIAYLTDGREETAFVGADRDSLVSFRTVLFKALLSGTAVRFVHPVSVGGRHLEPPVRTGRIGIRQDGFDVSGTDARPGVDLDRVVDVGRWPRDWADARAVLSVARERDGRTVRSEFDLPDARTANLLRRFVRLEYTGRENALDGIDLPASAVRCLAVLHSLGAGTDPSSVLGADPDRTASLFAGLAEPGLVVEREGGWALTTTGRVAVHSRWGDIEESPPRRADR